MAPLDRFTHVPTPPQDGNCDCGEPVPVLTHRNIGNGGFWLDATPRTIDDNDDEIPGGD